MTIHELAHILKDMYANANAGEKTTMIHLFGIRYASEIKYSGIDVKEILKLAQMNESYLTEVQKGMRLSKYVVEKE